MAEMEKRLHDRIAVLKSIKYDVGVSKSKLETYDAELLNISSGGACIMTERVFRPGRVIRLRFPLKGSERWLPRLAEVKWVEPALGNLRMGLQFLNTAMYATMAPTNLSSPV